MGVGGVTSNDCLMLQFCTSKIQKKKNIPKNSSKFHAADTHGIAPMDPPVAEKVLKVEQTRQKKTINVPRYTVQPPPAPGLPSLHSLLCNLLQSQNRSYYTHLQ